MSSEPYDLLKSSDVQFVRIQWCDNANVIRGKAVHVRMLDTLLEEGVGISAAQQALPVMYDSVVANAGVGPVGEVRLVPDWSTLTVLSYARGHVRVLADMMRDGRPWALCPRDFLKRMIARAAEKGLEVRGAFENEFYLMKVDGEQLLPADESVFAATLSMDVNATVINDMTDALLAQKIAVEMYHPESGPGQQELTVRYTTALAAADQQIAVRETARAIAYRHGLRASFLPKIFADKAGSGCHLHLSLWRDDRNVFGDASRPRGLSAEGEAFMAGVLDHLPALMSITTPTPNSYRRLQPHLWSGAYRCWGFDNREAALRVPTRTSGAPTNFELKTVDASSNPYLALGAVIACGLDGVQRGLTLTNGVDVDPANLSERQRKAGAIDRLPHTLQDALAAMDRDRILAEALGAPLARAFTAVRHAEWDALNGIALEDEVSLLLERY